MNFFSGLEKFGFSGMENLDITQDKKEKKKKTPAEAKKVVRLTEKDYLLDKKIICPICDREFTTKTVKSARLKRLEPDSDLRPNFNGIDSVKYDVTVCPHCGYAALNNRFPHVSPTELRLIREGVASKFKSAPEFKGDTYTYEYAIERLKLTLVSTMVRRGKVSEKAYVCLKTAWLIRAQMKELPHETPEEKQILKLKNDEYNGFYKQAYEGFLKAQSTEMPPYCGMNNTILDFMLANMSMYFQQYAVASKLIGRLLQSAATPERVKDKCRDLKEEILKKAAEERQKAAEAPKES